MRQIPLTRGQFALVDDNVADVFVKLRWNAWLNPHTKTFYARRNSPRSALRRTTEYLHWYVVGKPLHRLVVDHINGDTLDNRRENLRVVTRPQNGRNNRHRRKLILEG